MFGALADDIGPAFQLQTRGAADEQLAEGGHRVACQRPERGLVGRHLTPAQDGQTLGLDDLLNGFSGLLRVPGRLRQKGDTGCVGTLFGEIEVPPVLAHRPQELVRNLDHDARTVATVLLGAGRAAVLEVQQGGDGLVDDVAAAAAVHVDDHRDAAGVVLIDGVVEPDTGGHTHLTLHMLRAAVNRRFVAGAAPRRVPPCVGERWSFFGVNR